LGKQNHYHNDNRREPQKEGANAAWAAIALFGSPGLVKTKRNEQNRKHKEVRPELREKSRCACRTRSEQKRQQGQTAARSGNDARKCRDARNSRAF